jgi:hypothetical protein
MNLPLILGLVIISIFAGGLVTWIGYYTPFMLISSVLMAIGAGLLTTLETDSNHAKWIGYQFIFGAGVGFGMQQSLVAIQTALPAADVAIGTSLMVSYAYQIQASRLLTGTSRCSRKLLVARSSLVLAKTSSPTSLRKT